MYTFVAGAGLRGERELSELELTELLRSAAAKVVRELPDVGAPLRIDVLALPEIQGGWASIRPDITAHQPLISSFTDAELAILVWGQLDTSGDPAQVMRDVFARDGARAAAELGGVFSAIVIERRTRRLTSFGSVPGCRSLRYWTSGPRLVLSPIDLGVVALSGCEVRTDPTSMAVLAACGWPLGGATALVGVHECQAYQNLRWADGVTKIDAPSSFARRSRIDVRDELGIARKVDEVIEELRGGMRAQIERRGVPNVDVPLTAGIDSRAVLALFLSLVDRKHLRTYTRGDESQDVRVARALSRTLGVVHETRPTELPSNGAFASNARFLAIATNGIANADAAVGSRFVVRHEPAVPLGGGGEVFRGFYYNYLRRAGSKMQADALGPALLRSPLRRLNTARFADPGFSAAASARLSAAIAALESMSEDPYDLADLFYIFERMGRWGSSSWRRSLGASFVPFANHRAMAAAFELPAPIGDHAIVPTIIARYGGWRAYHRPINGAELLMLEGPGRARHVTREVLRLGAKLVRKSRQSVRPRERTPRQLRTSYLRDNFADFLHDTLGSQGSVAAELFTKEQQRRLLKGSTADDLALLGAVLSLDLWRQSLERVAATPR